MSGQNLRVNNGSRVRLRGRRPGILSELPPTAASGLPPSIGASRKVRTSTLGLQAVSLLFIALR